MHKGTVHYMLKAGSENESSMPHLIDPERWVERGGELVLNIPVKSYKRLLIGALSDAGDIEVNVRFRRSDHGYAKLRGFLRTKLVLPCQRCLEAVSVPVMADLEVFLLTDETQAEDLRDDQDYVVFTQGQLDLPELFEEELILAMPLVARHDDCEPQAPLAEVEPEPMATSSARENPFLVLASLKTPDTK